MQMRRNILSVSIIAVLVACIAAGSPITAAQDVGEAVRINQGSLQGMGKTTGKAIQINPLGTEPTLEAPTTVQDAGPQRPLPKCNCTLRPVFSVAPGALAAGTQVTIISGSPNAAIFYTTDGWTPTEHSPRYTGPITIQSDTRLQAIAMEPQMLPSTIAEADYTVNNPQALQPQAALAVLGVLRKGAALRLVTAGDVTSDTAQAGDHLPLRLDENVMDGEAVVAAKGTHLDAVITRVEAAGENGKPGVITFEVQPLTANGITIPLAATLTLQAPLPASQSETVANASLVHIARALPPGQEAEIEPNMPLTAYVAADTMVHH
jgi:hypothetical protein